MLRIYQATWYPKSSPRHPSSRICNLNPLSQFIRIIVYRKIHRKGDAPTSDACARWPKCIEACPCIISIGLFFFASFEELCVCARRVNVESGRFCRGCYKSLRARLHFKMLLYFLCTRDVACEQKKSVATNENGTFWVIIVFAIRFVKIS